MALKLCDLATIWCGYQHRDYPPIGAVGEYRILQLKDVDEAGNLRMDRLYRVTPVGNADNFLVKQGDLLFLSRGSRFTAVTVSECPEKTIAAYFFYIVRPHGKNVMSEYLTWFINQSPTQAFLGSRARGSNAKMIPLSEFRNLEVNVPPTAVQRTIVELDRLRKIEEKCLARIARARVTLVRAVSLQMVKGEGV